jgi:hypothetical protein
VLRQSEAIDQLEGWEGFDSQDGRPWRNAGTECCDRGWRVRTDRGNSNAVPGELCVAGAAA